MIDVALYWFAISCLAALAAALADDGLRTIERATRWVWLAALWAPPILLVAPLLIPDFGVPGLGGALAGVAVVEIPGFLVGSEVASEDDSLSRILAGLWLLSCAVMAFVLLRTHLRLRRDRTTWDREAVLGGPVFVSVDQGPAVSGVLPPWIVLPRWALDLPAEELELVVLHESEHLRGRDPLLLIAALGAVAIAPWNPVAWWTLRRLRGAMEVDCDRRVLRQRPEPALYGNSLIRVAARASGVSLGLAAFSARPVNLQRRIVTMTSVRTPSSSARSAMMTLAAVVVAVQGCGVDSPVTIDDRDAQTVDLPTAPATPSDIRAEPTFTPFTDAPSILNRSDVVASMAREYPPLLRDAGIGGTVRVYFFINESGRVEQVRIDQSSGHPALDEAAINVAGAYDFSPALNDGEPVPVWVSFPITFRVDRVSTENRPSND